MRTLKLTIAYDGTNYVGWQRQLSGVSVQQLIEEACVPLAGGAVAVAGAGRTDAGVHAAGQIASLEIDTALPVATVQRALNYRLPVDVRVIGVLDAAPGFHARFDARGKRYHYRIVTSPVLSPFDRWFVWHAPEARDLAAMRQAGALLIGRHDFASFQSGTDIAETIRTIRCLEIRDDRAGELVFDIEGDGFLKHMVRAIVGTLAEIGGGQRPPEAIRDILAAGDRHAAGRTAAARGLTLMSVSY